MIDTHCHLLPGVDDGARSEQEAIRMARKLREFGVDHVVCTPHYSRRYRAPAAYAAGRLRELQAALETLEIELRTDLAAEVSPELALTAPDEELIDRSFQGGFLLVELVSTTQPEAISAVTARLATLQLGVILGHPERCKAVQQRPDLVDDHRAAGGLVQVVAGSLVGHLSEPTTRTAWNLIDAGRADLLASDAHRPTGARIQLSAVASVVAERFGADVVADLTSRTPARVVRSDAPG